MDNIRWILGPNILLHIILVLICINAQETSPPDIVLLQDIRVRQTTCVAGAGSRGQGLAFITPVDYQFIEPEFKYKNMNGSDIDISIGCDFEKLNSCTNSWSTSNLEVMQSGYIPLSPVIDERWNNFNIITAGCAQFNYSDSLKYRIKTVNFHISFSVRRALQANILLCESNYFGPKERPCYWLTVEDFSSKTATLWKCAGYPGHYYEVDEKCGTPQAKIDIQRQLFSGQNEWRHFTIARENGNQIKLWEESSNEPLLYYTDTSKRVLNIEEMYFCANIFAQGQWKVHDYTFLNIKQGNTRIKLGPSIRFKEHTPVCLSLYVIMCSNCSITIKLENGGNDIEAAERGTYNAIPKWKNIRLISDVGLPTDIYNLYVQGSADTNVSNPFWAIDDVRHCFIDEVRVASLKIDPKHSVSCHSLTYPEWTISDNSKYNNKPNDAVQCTDPTRIGRYCNISCQAVKGTEYCNGNKICRAMRNSVSENCTCGSGYQWPTCIQECPFKFYGYNCANSCGNCKYSLGCSKISGECNSGCSGPYFLPHCQIPLYSVSVIKISHTNITVQIDNDTITDEEDVTTFQIQFQDVHNNTDWIPYDQPTNFELGATVVINGLRPETTYSIRAILYTGDGNAHIYNDVPVITTCNVNRQTVITPGKRNAYITLSDNEENCLLKNYIYTIKVGNGIIQRNKIISNVTSAENLVPYTDYEITIENTLHEEYRYTGKFKTLEDGGILAGSIWMIFGIIFVITLFLAVCTILILKVRKEKKLQNEILMYIEGRALENLNPGLCINDQAELLPYDKKWEFPMNRLKFGEQLGSGAFGVVMKAEAIGLSKRETLTTVAVKMIKRNAKDICIKALVSELKIMIHLGKHLNIVNLLGACTKNITRNGLYVIVEYCRFGNLRNYLLRHRDGFVNQIDPKTGTIDANIGSKIAYRTVTVAEMDCSFYPNPSSCATHSTSTGENTSVLSNNEGNGRSVSSHDLLCWAFQVSRGMEYLASRKVLHGDLAARNILLAEDNIVKICDFGLARNIYQRDNYTKKGDDPLPVKWMAIESIRDRIFSTQSDVWSFGILLWEFFSLATIPYPGMEAGVYLINKLFEGYRLEQPEYSTNEIYQIMLDCWNTEPTARPSFTELVENLGCMLQGSVRTHYLELNDDYMASQHESFANEPEAQTSRNLPMDTFSPRSIDTAFDSDVHKRQKINDEPKTSIELKPMLHSNGNIDSNTET